MFSAGTVARRSLVLCFLAIAGAQSATYAQLTMPLPDPGGGGAAAAGRKWLLPANNNATQYWNQNGDEFLKFTAITGSGKTGALFSEVYSGFIRNTVRVSLGATVAAAEDDSTGSAAALQRLIAGGGNLSLGFQLPIVSITPQNLSLFVIATPRGGVDLPAAGNATDDVTGNGDLGFDALIIGATDDNKLRVPVHARPACVFGTDKFNASIGHPSGAFCYLYASVGLQYEILRVSFGGVVSGPSAMRDQLKTQLSVSIVRQ